MRVKIKTKKKIKGKQQIFIFRVKLKIIKTLKKIKRTRTKITIKKNT
jgi:hypothetical protein